MDKKARFESLREESQNVKNHTQAFDYMVKVTREFLDDPGDFYKEVDQTVTPLLKKEFPLLSEDGIRTASAVIGYASEKIIPLLKNATEMGIIDGIFNIIQRFLVTEYIALQKATDPKNLN